MLEPGHDCLENVKWVIGGVVAWAMTLKAAIVLLFGMLIKEKDKRRRDHAEALRRIRGGG